MNPEPIPDPEVTIILPVYNAEKFLACALDSALNQTLREIEVIAVDDGSSDGSYGILTERAASDSRLRVFRQEKNSGTLTARIRGLQECRGKYVMFLDPDDFLDPSAAEKLSALAREKQADIVHFGTREFTRRPDGTIQERYNWTPPADKWIAGKGEVLRYLLVSGGIWSLCFKLTRTEICRRALAGGDNFYCIMGEDLYFYLLIAYQAERYLQTSQPYYRYDTTTGVTASNPDSPEKFIRSTATILDALDHGEAFLREKHVLDDPELAAGWEKIVRSQYLILWNRWYYRLKPGERGEIGEYLLQHASNKELFLLSLFDENDYLRENEEFLKFSRMIYKIMNRLFPKNSYLRMKLKAWYKKSAGKEKK